MDSVKLYQENECDSVISIGGGSTHDAGKGARLSVARDGRNVNDFEGFNMSENPKNLPHIAISTTAGTGAETSWAHVSRLNFEPSLANAIQAIKLTAENLRPAVWNGEDLAGRQGPSTRADRM